MHTSIILCAIVGTSILYLLTIIYYSLASPLRAIPGPLPARFTRIWYFVRVCYGHFNTENIDLHKKYGGVVRISPNQYSIDDPAAIKTIYGFGSKFPKSDWYYGWQHPDPDRYTVFPDRDMKRHADTRKRFQAMFSMSSLVNYEDAVNESAGIFDERLRELASGGRTMNMGHWFQCYAFGECA